jgi:hypothetical protein
MNIISALEEAEVGSSPGYDFLLPLRQPNWVTSYFVRSPCQVRKNVKLPARGEILLSLSLSLSVSKPVPYQSSPTRHHAICYDFSFEQPRKREIEYYPYKRFSNLQVHPLGYRKGWERERDRARENRKRTELEKDGWETASISLRHGSSWFSTSEWVRERQGDTPATSCATNYSHSVCVLAITMETYKAIRRARVRGVGGRIWLGRGRVVGG